MAAKQAIRFYFCAQAVDCVRSSRLKSCPLFEHSPPTSLSSFNHGLFNPCTCFAGTRMPRRIANCSPIPTLIAVRMES